MLKAKVVLQPEKMNADIEKIQAALDELSDKFIESYKVDKNSPNTKAWAKAYSVKLKASQKSLLDTYEKYLEGNHDKTDHLNMCFDALLKSIYILKGELEALSQGMSEIVDDPETIKLEERSRAVLFHHQIDAKWYADLEPKTPQHSKVFLSGREGNDKKKITHVRLNWGNNSPKIKMPS